MKYLKIEDSKGQYWDGTGYQEIDKISKDALLKLLNNAEDDSFEMDKYDDTLLPNKAHQIIYENIFTKFNDFLADKDHFKKEVEKLYNEAINKYSAEIRTEHTDEENFENEDDSEGADKRDIPF